MHVSAKTNCQAVFQSLYHFAFPPAARYERSQVLHNLTSTWYCPVFCFVLSILISGAVPHCGLICISLMTYDEHLFMCFICYPYIFFGGVSGQVSCPFFSRSFAFMLLSFEKSLYILDVGPLLLIFSPQLWLVFSFS